MFDLEEPKKRESPSNEKAREGEMLWLEDVRVVDLSNVIAGPCIGQMLGRFGAVVTKIDAVTPSYDPLVTIIMGVPAQRTKESMLLDIRKGRDVLEKLVRETDVVLMNCPPVQLKSLGLTLEDLRQWNESVILMHFDAYGGPKTCGSKLENHISYDDCIQAAIGIAQRFGGYDTPEEHAQIGQIDSVSGAAGAFAVCQALYHRQKSGRGCTARCSLASVGQFLQFEFTCDNVNEPSGREARGWHAFRRSYFGSDGNSFFMQQSELNAVNSEKMLSELRAKVPMMKSVTSEEDIAKTFEKHSALECVRQLKEAGIRACMTQTLDELRENYTVDAMDISLSAKTIQFLREKDHPFGEIVMSAPCAIRSLRGGHRKTLSFAPKYGQSTIAILKRLGFTDDQIQTLIAEKICGTKWSETYCPM